MTREKNKLDWNLSDQEADEHFEYKAKFAKFSGESEESLRERLYAHWPGHRDRVDIIVERRYHPERRN